MPKASEASNCLFWERAYLAVALTHFCVDVLNSSRTLLVAILAVNIGLTNAQVGSYFLGLLADQIGLTETLQLTAVLPLIAATAILFLPPKLS